MMDPYKGVRGGGKRKKVSWFCQRTSSRTYHLSAICVGGEGVGKGTSLAASLDIIEHSFESEPLNILVIKNNINFTSPERQ